MTGNLGHKSFFQSEFGVDRLRSTAWVFRVVLGLRGKVLVVGGATKVATVRSCQKLPPCLTEPMPAGSKTDPPLAKAKPFSNGRAYGITYLRRWKKNCCRRAARRGVRICQKQLCRHQGQ